MNEELEQLLRNLRLGRTLEIYDEQLRKAEEHDQTHSEFFVGLMRAQWHARQEQALDWRIKRAALPEQWSLESFPFAKQPGINRRQIRAFAELDFIPKAENIVFIGPTGVGKTGLASGLLLKALQNGYRGQFVRAQDLFDEMYASLADRSSRKLVNRLARLDVLGRRSCCGRVKFHAASFRHRSSIASRIRSRGMVLRGGSGRLVSKMAAKPGRSSRS